MTHLHTFLASAAVFTTLGAWTGPKVRAWILGVPSNVRVALKTVESNLVAKIKSAEAAVLNEFHVTMVPVVAPVAKPVAPVVAAPVVAPVAVSLAKVNEVASKITIDPPKPVVDLSVPHHSV